MRSCCTRASPRRRPLRAEYPRSLPTHLHLPRQPPPRRQDQLEPGPRTLPEVREASLRRAADYRAAASTRRCSSTVRSASGSKIGDESVLDHLGCKLAARVEFAFLLAFEIALGAHLAVQVSKCRFDPLALSGDELAGSTIIHGQNAPHTATRPLADRVPGCVGSAKTILPVPIRSVGPQ